MHLVHLFQIAWFTVNTLYRSTYPRLVWITRCTSSTFSFQFFFFFSSNSLFHKDFYRAGCKTSAIWACKHWIFLFPGCGDESDGVEFKIDENKNLPKLRSCKTKPTRCIQNNERTLRKFVQQWGVCQPCSGVLVDEIVLHGRDPLFFFFFVGGRPPSYSRVALQFCVHRFSPSLGETLRHLEPGVNKKCHEHHTIILGVIDLCRTEGH